MSMVVASAASWTSTAEAREMKSLFGFLFLVTEVFCLDSSSWNEACQLDLHQLSPISQQPSEHHHYHHHKKQHHHYQHHHRPHHHQTHTFIIILIIRSILIIHSRTQTNDLLVWLPLRRQQSPTPDTNISSALLIPARTRRESSPSPPHIEGVPSQKRLIYQGNDPPPPKSLIHQRLWRPTPPNTSYEGKTQASFRDKKLDSIWNPSC